MVESGVWSLETGVWSLVTGVCSQSEGDTQEQEERGETPHGQTPDTDTLVICVSVCVPSSNLCHRKQTVVDQSRTPHHSRVQGPLHTHTKSKGWPTGIYEIQIEIPNQQIFRPHPGGGEASIGPMFVCM